MPTQNFTSKPLSQVEELLEDAPLLTKILIETNGQIKRYSLKTKILDKISTLANIIGKPFKEKTETEDEQPATGFYEKFDILDARIKEIDDNIGVPGSAEGSTGIYNRIETIEKNINTLNKKNSIEGECFQFTTKATLNKNKEIRYKISGYNIFDLAEDAIVNLQLNTEFEIKNTSYGKLYYSPIINLNTMINNSSHLTIVYFPVADVKLVLKIDVTGTDITIKIENDVNLDNFKNSQLTIQNSNLLINKITLSI